MAKKKIDKFMARAFQIARAGVRKGQSPFGAVIVKNNKIIAEAHNTVWEDRDITAHAEINAIKKACKKLRTIDLMDCQIYSTTEPCPMCFSAIHWARISVVVYATTIGDSSYYGFNEMFISNKTLKEKCNLPIIIISNFYRGEGLKLFEEWRKKNGKVY